MQDQKFDLTTNAASKMLLALFVALKIKPSLSGLIEAAGQQPDVVFAALDQAVERTPQLIGNLDALLAMLRETADRGVRIEAKLDALLRDRRIALVTFDTSEAEAHTAELLAPPTE